MGFSVVSCVGKGLTKSFQARESNTHNQHAQSLGASQLAVPEWQQGCHFACLRQEPLIPVHKQSP